MSERQDNFAVAWWADNLAQLDGEIARLAMLCQVPLAAAGVLRRVLQDDAAVCGTDNPAAFAKLRALLMMHLALRTRSVEAIGPQETAAIEAQVAEQLALRFPGAVGHWPPG